MNEELQFARMHSTYEQWNLLSQMNQQLTECHNLKEFIELLGSFQYLVRNVENIFLCLFDGWHKSKSEINKIHSYVAVLFLVKIIRPSKSVNIT